MTKKEFCDFFTNYYGEKVDNICQISDHSYTGKELYEFVSAALRQPPVTSSNAFERLPKHWKYVYYMVGGIIIGLLLHYCW